MRNVWSRNCRCCPVKIFLKIDCVTFRKWYFLFLLIFGNAGMSLGVGKDLPLIFDICLDNYVYLFWILCIQIFGTWEWSLCWVQASQATRHHPPRPREGQHWALCWLLLDIETRKRERRPPAVSKVMQMISKPKKYWQVLVPSLTLTWVSLIDQGYWLWLVSSQAPWEHLYNGTQILTL